MNSPDERERAGVEDVERVVVRIGEQVTLSALIYPADVGIPQSRMRKCSGRSWWPLVGRKRLERPP